MNIIPSLVLAAFLAVDYLEAPPLDPDPTTDRCKRTVLSFYFQDIVGAINAGSTAQGFVDEKLKVWTDVGYNPAVVVQFVNSVWDANKDSQHEANALVAECVRLANT